MMVCGGAHGPPGFSGREQGDLSRCPCKNGSVRDRIFSLRYPSTTMQPASWFTSLSSWFTSGSSVFLTVISGVLVFVLGQLLLKGILEPELDLKDRIARISKQLHLLVHQRSTLDRNYGFTEDDIKIIGELSAEIHSLPSRILLIYSKDNCLKYLSCLLEFMLGLPSRNNLEEACDKLNEMSYKLRELKSAQEQIECHSDIQETVEERQRMQEKESMERIENLIPQVEELLAIINLRQSPPSPSKNAQARR